MCFWLIGFACRLRGHGVGFLLAVLAVWSGLLLSPVRAQSLQPKGEQRASYRLKWLSVEREQPSVLDQHLPRASTVTREGLYRAQQNALQTLWDAGYWGASVDSVAYRDSVVALYFYTGPSFAYRARRQEASPQRARPRHWKSEAQKQVDRALDQGHPFIRAQLRPSVSDTSGDSAAFPLEMQLDSGRRVYFDSLEVRGHSEIDPRFLRRALGWEAGAPFSQNRLDEAQRLLEGLPYLKVLAPPRVVFYRRGAAMRLYLEDRSTSYINGFAGLLPGQGEQSAQLTGEAALFLENVFGRGMEMQLEWRRPQQASQELELTYSYPYVGGRPVRLGGHFRLDKYDTVYLQLEAGLSAGWQLNPYREVELRWNLRRSFGLEGRGEQAGLQNYRIHLWGLGFHHDRVRKKGYMPYQGLEVHTVLSTGQKTGEVLSAGRGSAVEASGGGQEIALRVVEWTFNGRWLRPVGPKTSVLAHWRGAHWMDSTVGFNQQYRIGGLRTLRGTPERSLFTSSYGMVTTALRQMLPDGSYLSLFHDVAWLDDFENRNTYRRVHGMGAGYNFATAMGLFSLQYAYGVEPDRPIDWRSGWVHFGFTGRF